MHACTLLFLDQPEIQDVLDQLTSIYVFSFPLVPSITIIYLFIYLFIYSFTYFFLSQRISESHHCKVCFLFKDLLLSFHSQETDEHNIFLVCATKCLLKCFLPFQSTQTCAPQCPMERFRSSAPETFYLWALPLVTLQYDPLLLLLRDSLRQCLFPLL